MINQGNNVPDKTIAVFPVAGNYSFYDNKKNDRLSKIIEKPSKKRNWFNSHFYRCLPLTIGNQYGFVIKSEFDFTFIWDGGDSPDSIKFWFNEEQIELDKKFPRIETHFGSGIITISPPFILRTPPGVNLMTINPPNYVIPNITVMTGVVETDNIRRNFTFNLKVQMPNIPVELAAGAPLAAFIPIPRYYGDSFELKYAEEIFDEKTIDEEFQANEDTSIFRREVEPTLPYTVGRQYFKGEDVYGNKFPDHQK
jgi:hypothetical protein